MEEREISTISISPTGPLDQSALPVFKYSIEIVAQKRATQAQVRWASWIWQKAHPAPEEKEDKMCVLNLA